MAVNPHPYLIQAEFFDKDSNVHPNVIEYHKGQRKITKSLIKHLEITMDDYPVPIEWFIMIGLDPGQ